MHVDLYWLDVPERVKFKLVSMVHNYLHHKAPRYLMDYCIPISEVPVDDIFVLPGIIISFCLDTVSARMGVASGICCCLPNCLKLTER